MTMQRDVAERFKGAVCATLPLSDVDRIFFRSTGGGPKSNPAHKKYCRSCPVQTFCMAYGIVYEERGVWGGLTDKDRSRLNPLMKIELKKEALRQGWYENQEQEEVVPHVLDLHLVVQVDLQTVASPEPVHLELAPVLNLPVDSYDMVSLPQFSLAGPADRTAQELTKQISAVLQFDLAELPTWDHIVDEPPLPFENPTEVPSFDIAL